MLKVKQNWKVDFQKWGNFIQCLSLKTYKQIRCQRYIFYSIICCIWILLHLLLNNVPVDIGYRIQVCTGKWYPRTEPGPVLPRMQWFYSWSSSQRRKCFSSLVRCYLKRILDVLAIFLIIENALCQKKVMHNFICLSNDLILKEM